MQGMTLVSDDKRQHPRCKRGEKSGLLVRSVMGIGLLLLAGGCASAKAVAPRKLQLYQNWALQPGSEIAGYSVVGGLGDVAIALNGKSALAPFDGMVEPTDTGCLVFSSPEVPAYAFRLCGLQNPKLGRVRRGDRIGSGDLLQFAVLRRQPDGRWAIVEPAIDVLERIVKAP